MKVSQQQSQGATSIYGLLDPTDSRIHYIGHSSRPVGRLRNHIKDGKERPGHNWFKEHWIATLLRRSHVPRLVILQKDACAEDEVAWIAFGREVGWPLTNIHEGGLGGAVVRARFLQRMTPEERTQWTQAESARQKAGWRRRHERMTDEEREAERARWTANGQRSSAQMIATKRAKFDALPLEEQAAILEFMRDWHAAGGRAAWKTRSRGPRPETIARRQQLQLDKERRGRRNASRNRCVAVSLEGRRCRLSGNHLGNHANWTAYGSSWSWGTS